MKLCAHMCIYVQVSVCEKCVLACESVPWGSTRVLVYVSVCAWQGDRTGGRMSRSNALLRLTEDSRRREFPFYSSGQLPGSVEGCGPRGGLRLGPVT